MLCIAALAAEFTAAATASDSLVSCLVSHVQHTDGSALTSCQDSTLPHGCNVGCMLAAAAPAAACIGTFAPAVLLQQLTLASAHAAATAAVAAFTATEAA
jgi:hypothetical protein